MTNPLSIAPTTWSLDRAQRWHQAHPWLVGCNYIPHSAGNQLEMWQRESFDPACIDRELAWAQSLGFNSLRVYLHDLVWQHDSPGMLARMSQFLDLAHQHGMGVLWVLFDSCWHPFPRRGPQRPPEPGVHNSMWVQSPGLDILRSPHRFAQLEAYVRGIIRHFAHDARIHGWDLWNEPDNPNLASYGPRDLPHAEKAVLVAPLLEQVFLWARSESPAQPLTSAVWLGDWSTDDQLRPIERVQLAHSDILSFHNYEPAARLDQVIRQLQRFDRPMLCTEYMARGNHSTFATCLPVLKSHQVGAYNWGLVAGRSQTQYPWDSWQKCYDPQEPPIWFHDIFRPTGEPYLPEEVQFLRDTLQSTLALV